MNVYAQSVGVFCFPFPKGFHYPNVDRFIIILL